MNIHALTFEQILRLCSSMEDPIEISKLIQALEILERNIRYRRKELIGQLNEIESSRQEREAKRASGAQEVSAGRPCRGRGEGS